MSTVTPSSIMFNDPSLALINILLIIGIALALYVAPKIKKGTQELHAENLAARGKLFGHSEN